jgi:hypothetical protein
MPDGHKAILAARATKPLFGPGKGELVLFDMPTVANPFAAYALPWRETVLVNGPDVMFHLTDLDDADGTVEVFAAEFFSRKLTMHSIRWGDARRGTLAQVTTPRNSLRDHSVQCYERHTTTETQCFTVLHDHSRRCYRRHTTTETQSFT